MLETVKAKFPHLSERDCIDIAIFVLEYGKSERMEVYNFLNKKFDVL